VRYKPATLTTEVFAIPLENSYLVYAPLRRVAFAANARTVNLLQAFREGKETPGGEEGAGLLKLIENTGLAGEEGDWPVDSLRSDVFKPKEVTLFLTTSCNLRCVYCYASAGERPVRSMDLDTAKRGIDFVCRNALDTGSQGFTVGYHGGGEPTSHWEVLTESFAYAKHLARKHGLELDGSMATNGVLTPEKAEWVINNFGGVNISMDGLPFIQDMQRPLASGGGSAKRVLDTIAAFDRASFHYGLRITVTGASVGHLPKSVKYLLDHAEPEHIQVESMYVLGRGRGADLAADPAAFVEAFREAKGYADRRGVDLFYSSARAEVLTDRFCRSCGEGFSLTPEGLVSACYEVPDGGFEFADEFMFGKYDEATGQYVFDGEKLARLRGHTVETVPWCRDCFCKWHCAGDCMYKARHSEVEGEFAGDPRCEITRALTIDQILGKIRQSGGVFWAEPLGH